MGCFSWMYCDTNNTYALDIGNAGYLLNPFGDNYFTRSYDGYGGFDGHDVYDLVADGNKKFIPTMLEYIKRGDGECDISKHDIKNLIAFHNNKPISCDKRGIGIMMACYDEDNARLLYPIKVASKDMEYMSVVPSLADPNQGFGYDEEQEYIEYFDAIVEKALKYKNNYPNVEKIFNYLCQNRDSLESILDKVNLDTDSQESIELYIPGAKDRKNLDNTILDILNAGWEYDYHILDCGLLEAKDFIDSLIKIGKVIKDNL